MLTSTLVNLKGDDMSMLPSLVTLPQKVVIAHQRFLERLSVLKVQGFIFLNDIMLSSLDCNDKTRRMQTGANLSTSTNANSVNDLLLDSYGPQSDGVG